MARNSNGTSSAKIYLKTLQDFAGKPGWLTNPTTLAGELGVDHNLSTASRRLGWIQKIGQFFHWTGGKKVTNKMAEDTRALASSISAARRLK